MKFRLLYGNHVDTHLEDKALFPVEKRREVRYRQGAVIETEEDLTKLNGAAGDARKFEMLSEEGTPMQPSPFLWNRERETLEQFTARMLAIGATKLPEQSYEAHTVPEVPRNTVAQTQTTVSQVAPTFTPGEDKTLTLKSMSVDQLRKHAETEEIDLSALKGPAVKDKDAILKIILAEQQKLVGAGK